MGCGVLKNPHDVSQGNMTDLDGRNYYELLGLEPGVTTDVIKEAYREIARIYHPDSNFYDDIIADSGPEDSDVFKAITAAYQVLINEEKRKAYDETLPKGLDGWGESDSDDGGFAPGNDDEDIPEEWKKERQYFAEHFDEILKPGPRSNLTGAAAADFHMPAPEADEPFTSWSEPKAETVQAGTRFGDLSEDAGAIKIDAIPAARRTFDPGMSKDPFQLIVFIGIPLMALVVIVEVLILYG
jgi:curved DNA-binding protein CbpA